MANLRNTGSGLKKVRKLYRKEILSKEGIQEILAIMRMKKTQLGRNCLVE